MRIRTLMMMATVALVLASCAATAEAKSYNVRQPPFNAAGDGSNDTIAVQAAVNAAIADGGGEVYFPAGTYAFTDTIHITTSVTLRGDGQRTSTLRWHNLPSGGIGLAFYYPATPPARFGNLTIRGLSFIKYDFGGGTAIWTSFPAFSGTQPRYLDGGGVTATLEDFHIGGIGGAYWHTGVFLGGAISAKISTFNIHGVANSSDYGIRMSSTVGATIHNGNISGYKVGVRSQDGSEGLNVHHVGIRDADTGIDIVGAGKGNALTSNQIWATYYGVNLSDSVGDFAVVNNQIYRQNDVYFVGIDVHGTPGAVSRTRIIGNTIYAAPGTTQTRGGVRMWNNVSDSVIQGNITQNMTFGIWLAGPPGSPLSVISGSMVFGNINRNAVAAITNDGVNTYCVANAPNPPNAPNC
jgi:hypothetical protein